MNSNDLMTIKCEVAYLNELLERTDMLICGCTNTLIELEKRGNALIQIVLPTRHGVGLGKRHNRAKYLGIGSRWNIIDNQERGKDNEQAK